MSCSNELQEIEQLREQLERCQSSSVYAKLARALKKLFAKHEEVMNKNNKTAPLLFNANKNNYNKTTPMLFNANKKMKNFDLEALVEQLAEEGHKRPRVVADKIRRTGRPHNHFVKATGKLKKHFK